ncbi:HlyD family secretion protein [Anditalea andensis]|uniref:Secretion protein HlyD n=1 Tax=Anditalea andensis TaxID=1048983 RepID=A0A074L4I3_9BACT|nr:HlyD family efflux transporter periplasmic adaptor subunit [Anditalea andensis]KEO75405.1 secretion protein HlyD [Anditalea andensis]
MPDQKAYSTNLHLRSDEVQEIISTPPAWLIRWGITLVFILTAVIIILSFLIKYPDYVQAKILVTTMEPTERVLARASGQIEKLFVNNGDAVTSGQMLAGIKSTAALEDVLFLKEILEYEAFGKENNYDYPMETLSNLTLGEVEPTFLDFERNYMEYQLLEELQPYIGKMQGSHYSLQEINNRIQSQVIQKELLERRLKLVQIDYLRNKVLHEDGVISDKDFENREMEYLQMQEQINSMAIVISQMQEALSTGNQTLRVMEINKQEEETRVLKNLIQSYHSLKRAVRDWEYIYLMSSSTGGLVSFQKIWSSNQQVSTGELVFTVLPENKEELVGAMKIPAQNAGKVAVGQKVLIKLDNYPYQQYGTLLGEVIRISVTPDDEFNYLVYAYLPEGTRSSFNNNIPFNQELLGNAEIITEDLSVAERLFFKFKSVLDFK